MPQKPPDMVLYGMFSQPYSQYPVGARGYMRSRLSFGQYLLSSCLILNLCGIKIVNF